MHLYFTLNTFVVFGSQGQNFNLLFPGNSVTGTTLKYIYAAIVGYCGMDAKKRKAMSHLKFGARISARTIPVQLARSPKQHTHY